MRESIQHQLFAYNENERLFMQGRKDRVSFLNEHVDTYDYVLGDAWTKTSTQLIDVKRHTRFLPVPPHRHSYIEAIYVYNGTFRQEIDGERITMHRGDIMILNQGITHSIDVTGQSDIAINLIIRPEFFSFLFSLVDVDNYIMNFIMDCMYDQTGNGGYLWYQSKGEKGKNDLDSIMEEIIEHLYEPTAASGITTRLLAGLMLVRLAEHSDDVAFYSADGYEKRISLDILRYIDAHYQDGTLIELSELIGQPDWRICRIVKRYTGRTFTQLLQDTRLAKAANLLTHTDRAVTEIAEQVGYHNMTYFYRLFKDRFDVTPAAYRKRQLG